MLRRLRDDERAALTARADELRPALEHTQPNDDDRVATALSDMFNGFPSMRQRGVNALGRIESAKRMLAKFPAWAIEQGCLSIQSDGYQVEGEDGGFRTERHWPPGDPEISEIVRKQLKPYAEALASAQALLTAPVEAPEHPRPTAEEIAAKLGRPVGPRAAIVAQPAPTLPGDGKHAQRVEAALAERRARMSAMTDADLVARYPS